MDGFIQRAYICHSEWESVPSDSVSALLYPLNITHETFFPGTGCQIRSGHKPWDCSPDVEGGIWPEVCSKHRHMLQIKKRLLFFLMSDAIVSSSACFGAHSGGD